MPHICTRCSNIFESGEDILKGCPACGWKKFMFVRKKPRDWKVEHSAGADHNQGHGREGTTQEIGKRIMAIDRRCLLQRSAPAATHSPPLCIPAKRSEISK